MSKDPIRQKQLFDAALEVDAPTRKAWLWRACGDDKVLFAAVWDLLQAHEAAGSFLASPESMVQRQLGVGRSPAPEPVTEQPGQLVGDYKLLEELGQGGFGTVWMAQQVRPVRRLVALKVLKAGMDSAQVVARFEQERQAPMALTSNLSLGVPSGPWFERDSWRGTARASLETPPSELPE